MSSDPQLPRRSTGKEQDRRQVERLSKAHDHCIEKVYREGFPSEYLYLCKVCDTKGHAPDSIDHAPLCPVKAVEVAIQALEAQHKETRRISERLQEIVNANGWEVEAWGEDTLDVIEGKLEAQRKALALKGRTIENKTSENERHLTVIRRIAEIPHPCPPARKWAKDYLDGREEQEPQGTLPTAEAAVRLYNLATKDGNEGIERAEFVMDDGGRVVVLAGDEEQEAQDEQ